MALRNQKGYTTGLQFEVRYTGCVFVTESAHFDEFSAVRRREESAMIALAEPTDLDTLRLRNEFLELPGLTVTIPQAARLSGVRRDRAADMLAALEHEGFLIHTQDGVYRRLSHSSAA